MSKATANLDRDAIIVEIEIAAPPERVFRALTDSGELAQWFKDASCPLKFWRMEARLGGHYSYETEVGRYQINGVTEFKCHGEILEFDPPRLLVYTWISNWHADPQAKTIVRWELAAIPGGTRVKMSHSGVPDEVSRKDYSGGWVGVLEKLEAFTIQHP
jgi:uncharacterized protein YndB with AHSA1/START domain